MRGLSSRLTGMLNREPWRAVATTRYNKRRKKLTPEVRRRLNEVQADILQDPYRGEQKRSALKNVRVVKLPAQNDQYLVAYEIEDADHTVVFLDIGQHENFYRDLEKHVRATE